MRYKKDDFVGVVATKPSKIVKIVGVTADSPDDNQVRYAVLYPDGTNGILRGDELDEQNKFAAWQPNKPSRFMQNLDQSAPQVYIPEKMKVSMPEGRARLLFRGDDRSPETIFNEGFKPREEHFTPLFRGLDRGAEKAQFDIAPQTAVAASPRPEVAALFPLKLKWDESKEQTYLYVFYVTEYFSTYTIQKQSAKLGGIAGRADVKHAISTKLFAKEVAIGKEGIPGIQTIGCWSVRRWWLGENWTVGTVYMVDEFKENPQNYLKVIKRSYVEFLNDLELQVSRMPRHYSPEDVR